MTRIIAIGEVMAEICRKDDDFSVGFAGDSFNTAVYCRRMLPEKCAVSYVTRLGPDPLSEGCIARVEAEGVDAALISRDATANIGIYSVATDTAGERSFRYWRNQSAARKMFARPDDTVFEAMAYADVIYFSGITLAVLPPENRRILLDWVKAVRETHGIQLAFDSNYRPALWEDRKTAQDTIASVWSMTDIALPSVDDEMGLFGDPDAGSVANRINAAGCTTGALKRGAEGPMPLGAHPCADQRFASAAKVVDTTAAGDSFNGAYLAALANGKSQYEALKSAHDLACHVIGHQGAIVPLQEEKTS
jgi:2-dehydro-3-deoxygluconokinase